MARPINDIAFQQLGGVRLEIRDVRGNGLTLHENEHQMSQGGSDFVSRAIHATPGDEIEIILSFSDEFELHGASSVRITLALGHTELDPSDLSDSQSFWIDADNLRNEHVFRFFSTWESDRGEAEAKRITIPVPDEDPAVGDRNVLWREMNMANKGCIAIFVAPGDLTDVVRPCAVHATDPPPDHRWKATDIPKVISPHWFEPITTDVAPPIVFELRNLVDANANAWAANAATSSRNRTVSPGLRVANLSEQRARELAIEESREGMRGAAQTDLSSDASVDSEETMHGVGASRIVRLPVYVRSNALGRKRGAPIEEATGEAEVVAPQPKRTRMSSTSTFGEPVHTSDSTTNGDEEYAAFRQVHIKQERFECIDLTQDDEDDMINVKEEKLKDSAAGKRRQETLEELQLKLRESEEQEKIHQERLRQAQIRRQMSGMGDVNKVVKREG